jgi:NitT/TauT family transport system ATP-binding protein
MSLVNITGVSLTYHDPEGETEALHDVNLSVEPREFVVIVGPSGCGKSSLLSIVAGLVKPSRGEAHIGGDRIVGPSRRIGYMLQHDYLFEWRTILDNALLGLEVRGERTRASVAEVKQLMQRYGLGGFERHYPRQLSGGMRQRAALIRTLAVRPDCLLLDEPFSALDYQTRLRVAEEVYRILKEEDKTVIMVTHDIAEAVSIADRIIVMTPRPGTILSEHKIVFGCPRRTPLTTRRQPEFPGYFNAVWKDLNSSEGVVSIGQGDAL